MGCLIGVLNFVTALFAVIVCCLAVYMYTKCNTANVQEEKLLTEMKYDEV